MPLSVRPSSAGRDARNDESWTGEGLARQASSHCGVTDLRPAAGYRALVGWLVTRRRGSARCSSTRQRFAPEGVTVRGPSRVPALVAPDLGARVVCSPGQCRVALCVSAASRCRAVDRRRCGVDRGLYRRCRGRRPPCPESLAQRWRRISAGTSACRLASSSSRGRFMPGTFGRSTRARFPLR